MQIRRFEGSPIIHAGLSESIGTNINGPSLVAAPPWVADPLGRYYLYFAHHQGQFIRLATADDLAGPWRVHEPGVLHLDQTACRGHVASPDVHVDEAARQVRMYFHGPCSEGQRTFLATSADGLRFEAGVDVLGGPYFRVFEHEGWIYALCMGGAWMGMLLRSRDGVSPFERGPRVIPRMRHAALRKRGDVLDIFFSRGQDRPERILRSRLSLSGPWTTWLPEAPGTVLAPERDYEGGDLTLEPSRFGAAHEPVRQLRDPGVFEQDGRTYLLYSVAGERGIALAELVE